jgi:penicillin-binding protein 2
LTEKEVARFSERKYHFEGVDVYAHLSRYYPLGASAVHAIGYVGRINERELQVIDQSNYSGSQHIGKVGVERFYESDLHGKVGFQEVETNAQGRVERILERTPPIPGNNLYLNIDMSLQNFIEGIVKEEKASVVAIDPKNGAVLAMVSMPYYDSNLFVNGIDVKTYHALRDSPDLPLYNRALNGRYPPGSTIKAFVGLAGLEYGVRKPNSYTWCPGWLRLKGQEHKYRDWKRRGHGSMDFHHAVEQSCDVYFYSLARDLGIDKLHRFMTRFSFGKKTGIDINGELEGLMPSSDWKWRVYKRPWYTGETLIAGIGQGFVLATPLQLAVATAILANRGYVNQPRLVFAIEKSGLREMVVVPSTPQDTITLREKSYWDIAIGGMEAVVHGSRGTAKRVGQRSKYRFAGKTGTAQVVGIKQDAKYDAKKLAKRFHDHALFVAFAPLESPRIAIAVIIENGGSGSKTAAPIAKKILDCYLLSLCAIDPEEKIEDSADHGDH